MCVSLREVVVYCHCGCFSDRFNNFDALKGCRWAYNSDDSFSGNLAVLEQLRKHGTNASFFGECIQSGNSIQHHECTELLLVLILFVIFLVLRCHLFIHLFI